MSKKKGGTKEAMTPDQVTEILNVNVLHDMINSLEETKLKLLLNIKELKEKLSQQKEDQADIYYYLNKKCDESFEVIASLEEQIVNEQTDREIAEKLYETKIEDLRTSASQNEARAASKIAELETKLEMLNSFNEEKLETDRQIQALMKQLEEERQQFKANAESIENKFLVERDKLRKTYDIKYEAIKKELESSVENKLSKKTKKTQIMNVIMKKELDNQSRHAEKLLEINHSLMERDKALKLELELAHSLQEDLTKRLALAQRSIKQLDEKVAEMESAEVAAAKSTEEKLAEKNEKIITLEAKLNQHAKKASAENAKMDAMWQFLSQSYQLLKARAGHGAMKVPTVVMADSAASSTSRAPMSASLMYDHEKMLVALVKAVAAKHPKIVTGMLSSADISGTQQSESISQQSLSQAASSYPGPGPGPGPSDSVADSSSGSTQWMSSTARKSNTGIPAWDMKTSNGEHYSVNEKSIRVRSIHVQTEGKLAPYPDGSFWLQAPGARSLLQQLQDARPQQQQQQQQQQKHRIDNDGGSSVGGYQSVGSYWAGDGEIGSSMSQISMDDTEAYSAKTASHVLGAKPGNTRSSKVISKARKLSMKQQQHAHRGISSGGGDVSQQISGEAPVGFGAEYLVSLEGRNIHHSVHVPAAPLQQLPATAQMSVASYVSQGSGLSSGGGILSPMGPPLAYRQTHFIQRMPGASMQHGQQQVAPVAASMSVSGQGFVAPSLVLPKL